MEGRVVYLSEVPAEPGYSLFDDVPHVFDRNKCAELLGVDVKTISREVQRGKLKCFHVGRNLRFTREALIEYVRGAESCM